MKDVDQQQVLEQTLLTIPGIAGVVWSDAGVTVLLEADKSEIRNEAETLLQAHFPGVRVTWKVTGSFQAL
jgi:phosphotransferase system IIB component